MKILALITARGGSKRLPGKNILMLGGKELIVWSIDVAKNIPEICDILVTTDDLSISEVCKEAGALVPWLRPDHLATDMASSVDVVLHALDWYETENATIDGLLLLQPTSPFRTKTTLERGIELFGKNDYQTVLGVSRTQEKSMSMLRFEGDYLVPFVKEQNLEESSQDSSPAYMVNGSFYLIAPEELRSYRSFVGLKTIPLLIESPQEALDIDTEQDFRMAELIVDSIYES